MAHAHEVPSRAEHVQTAVKGFILLLIITLLEVGVALIGNGHLIEGLHFSKWIMIPVMTAMSFYKAYYIVSEFMHLGHEARGMAFSVILPTFLLVWAIIAFLWEGDAWKNNRKHILDKNAAAIESVVLDGKPSTTTQPAVDTTVTDSTATDTAAATTH